MELFSIRIQRTFQLVSTIFGQIVRDKNTVFPVKKQTFSHSFNLLPQTERSLTSDDI